MEYDPVCFYGSSDASRPAENGWSAFNSEDHKSHDAMLLNWLLVTFCVKLWDLCLNAEDNLLTPEDPLNNSHSTK